MTPNETGTPAPTSPRTGDATASGPGLRAPKAVEIVDLAWKPATWLLLVVLCGALFLDGLDMSMVGVALPSIGTDLHLGSSSLQWIVSGYILGFGSLLLLGGRACDLLGRRQIFLIAVAVFGAASVLSGVISSDVLLIVLRFVKGAAAAFTVPAGLSIITTTFAEGPARNRALTIYTSCQASGFSLGLVIGGLLTELGWRVTFLVPGPIAIALVLIGWRVVPTSVRERVSLQQFDLIGALSSTVALLVLVFAVVEAPSSGWGSPQTIGLLVLSAVLMAVFVAVERRHPRPLVRLAILRSRTLLHANFSAAAMLGGYAGFQFVVTLYVQNSLGWSPLGMSLAFLPTGLLIMASAARMGAILNRFGTTKLIFAGMLALIVGYLLFLRVDPSMSYLDFMLPTMLLLGVGFALCAPSVSVQATSGVADHEQGLASGLLNTSLQIGSAVVLAVVSAVLSGSGSVAVHHHQLLPGMRPAIGVVAGVTLLALVATAFRLLKRPDTEPALAT
ncbi:MFS transporter [Streptomyces sp. SL13]|uniref:MFS transporter n=1 Tax=Streptantibioticus silvisoli TaxID=2705255 RepID=A0AA90H1S4_9ACTN|nr:MFS transporter [Streptantibioticus silvisoli]MDI5962202.1 MFS transporter [Streptantibioticus silvisoli]MDI5972468.1 MFS transporter [Streptantibioticus silvisoli]